MLGQAWVIPLLTDDGIRIAEFCSFSMVIFPVKSCSVALWILFGGFKKLTQQIVCYFDLV